MLETGSVVEVPGMRALVTAAPADVALDPLEMEIYLAPGALGAPAHYHPSVVEEYRVVTGILNVLLGAGWRDVAEGNSIVIPPGTKHTFRNRTETPVVLTNVHRPAGGFAAYWEQRGALSRAGGLTSFSDPRTVMLMSALIGRHRDALVATGFLGRVMMPLAAFVASVLRVDSILTAPAALRQPPVRVR